MAITKPKTKSTKSPAAKPRPVLVTTLHRGVFFGFTAAPEGAETIKLTSCRNVLYWPAECRGYLGLAANGPVRGAKVGPVAETVELRNITSVTDMSDATGKIFADFPVWT